MLRRPVRRHGLAKRAVEHAKEEAVRPGHVCKHTSLCFVQRASDRERVSRGGGWTGGRGCAALVILSCLGSDASRAQRSTVAASSYSSGHNPLLTLISLDCPSKLSSLAAHAALVCVVCVRVCVPVLGT